MLRQSAAKAQKKGRKMLEKSEKLVAAFNSTHDALLCETLCREAGVSGRLVPIPTDITADCGLCFMMPPEEKESFQMAIAGKLTPSGYYLRMLWG